MKPRSNSHRRDIITAGFASKTEPPAGNTKVCASIVSGEASDRQHSHVEQYTVNAMACQFELILNLHEYRNAGDVALKSFALIAAFEDQMSIYREHSEISQVNRIADRQSVAVEAHLYALLEMAIEVYKATDGAFDITSGVLSETWGFSRRQGSVPSDADIQNVLEITGSNMIQLHPDTKSVRFARPGLKLNPGGIGKGFAVDLTVALIIENGIDNFVIHAGQSSVVARGAGLSLNSNAASSGWRIGLSHPTIPGCRLAEICLVNAALGTSGTQRQGFFHRGKRFGHIIDPRTGYPTDHCLSATVICTSAARADALATAFFVMTEEQVREFCETHPDISAILLFPGKSDGEIRIESFNTDKLAIEYFQKQSD